MCKTLNRTHSIFFSIFSLKYFKALHTILPIQYNIQQTFSFYFALKREIANLKKYATIFAGYDHNESYDEHFNV